MRRCLYCVAELTDGADCRGCALYNAAVDAQRAAAASFTKAINRRAKDAWLNEHGIFAWVDGVVHEFAGSTEAAPFAALTSAALNAHRPSPLAHPAPTPRAPDTLGGCTPRAVETPDGSASTVSAAAQPSTDDTAETPQEEER